MEEWCRLCKMDTVWGREVREEGGREHTQVTTGADYILREMPVLEIQ